MRKIIVLLMCCLVLGGCGSKSSAELTDIEQFKCQDSIQTVFGVLGEREMEDNLLIGECYTYDNLNLYGYDGKATFRVRDDKETISSFEFYLKLNKKEFEDVLSQFEEKYGKFEKSEHVNQTAYIWEISDDEAENLGYNKISISDYGDKKVVIDFSDEWSLRKDEAYYAYLEEKEMESDRETIKSQDYRIENDVIKFLISIDKKQNLHLSIWCNIQNPGKASYVYYLYNNMINIDDMQKLNPILMVECGNVFLTSEGISYTTTEPLKIIKASEWCAEQMMQDSLEKDEIESLGDDLTRCLIDFMEFKE